MDRLTEMEAFITVVDQGGFTGAAQRLGISKSAVSKHISSLEARLGARLLDRTTRRVNPTEIGLSYYDRAKQVISVASDADEMVTSMQSTPRGMLRVSAPVSFGLLYGAPAIAEFLRTYQEISMDLQLSDHFVDLIEDGFDLALRIGALPDSTLKARKIAETELTLVASPGYISENGLPQSIDALSEHKLFHYSMLSTGNVWRLKSRSGEERQVRVGGALSANNGDVLLQAALSGLGIGLLPSFLVGDHIKAGRLTVLLDDHPKTRFGIHVVYPPGLYTQPKTRAFIDFMVDHFKGRGPTDW